MSKESYIRGFCKVAAAYGADPVQLAKFAASSDAGIGSLSDNFGEYVMHLAPGGKKIKEDQVSGPHVGSYFNALKRNNKDLVDLPSRTNFTRQNISMAQNVPLTQEQLERVRDEQAANIASKIFPKNTAPYHAIKNNLIRNGERNADEYRRTGTVKPRSAPDKSGIEDIQPPPFHEFLHPEGIKDMESKGVKNWDDIFTILQNTMARNGVPQTVNIA